MNLMLRIYLFQHKIYIEIYCSTVLKLTLRNQCLMNLHKKKYYGINFSSEKAYFFRWFWQSSIFYSRMKSAIAVLKVVSSLTLEIRVEEANLEIINVLLALFFFLFQTAKFLFIFLLSKEYFS